MFPNRPWQPASAFRLLSGLILAFGISNLAGFLMLPAAPAAGTPPAAGPAALLAATLCLHGTLLAVFTWFLKDEQLTWASFLRGNSPAPHRAILPGVALGIACILPMLLVSGLSTWIWKHLSHTPELQAPLELLKSLTHPAQKALFGLTAVISAPLTEEILFRGILYPALRNRGMNAGAWILSAAAFALIHLDREKFLPLMLLGILLVGVYEYTGSLLAPICTHAMFNLVNFLAFLNQDALKRHLEWVP